MNIKNIVFDFDGTIAKSTPYHRAGWEMVLRELEFGNDLNKVLPYEPNLKERFDSYRRIKEGFLDKEANFSKISSYFGIKDKDKLAKRIMELKESFTIKIILDEDLQTTLGNLGLNLTELLNNLKDKDISLGIISSTRETIINSFLYKCGILDLFDFIVGEESLFDTKGVLLDKPNPFAKKVLIERNLGMDLYIGDNKEIDEEFSKACGADFIFADYKTDFASLLTNINK